MKKLLFLPCLLLINSFLFSQNPSKVNIKGIVQDSAGAELPFATVMLLNPKDSALMNFTQTNAQAAFEFKNVKNVTYLLKVSYVGYIPYQQLLTPSVSEVNNLGGIRTKPITKELMEVVIKAAKAPLSIRGDTIEYNASSFKVPPGSTVEDLLRRLPGIEVDADGNIKAQGKDVKKLYVDGKTFFGDDPKAATKNLDAETISKVQVFNEKSDQAKLTGVDDGKKEKAMNLELKEEFKKGSFGKVTGAVGTSERWAARGSYNRFNKKEQFSFIGFANNINQTGINWDDYGEFKGQNSFNNNDNGDFGFGGGGGRYYYFNSNETPYFNNFDGRGFTKNAGSGLNYNFDNKKSKWSSSYFYNQTRLRLNQYSDRQNFLNNGSFFNTDTLSNTDFRGNHTLNTRLEQEIDSNNTVIIKAGLGFSNSDKTNINSQLFSKTANEKTNLLSTNTEGDINSFRLNTTAIYRHRFKKKGRVFAASGGFNTSNGNEMEDFVSINKFFNATTFTEQIRQLNVNDNKTSQAKSSLLFSEPLSKTLFLETFYNFRYTTNEVSRQVTNPQLNNELVDQLSVFYDFKTDYNRLGTSMRYSKEGINLTAGLAAQQLNLNGQYATARGQKPTEDPVKQNFYNWMPHVSLNFDLKNNFYIGTDYNYNISEPQINDLRPVSIVTNPAFVIQGNPNLKPERFHEMSANFNHFNPATFSNIGINGSISLYDSRIVYNQTVAFIDSVGYRTTTRPQNISGGYSSNIWMWTSFPIVKTKLTMNINGGYNFGKSPSFVNGIENETSNNGLSMNVGFNFTPVQKFIMDLRANINNNNISYSIQEQQNQKIRNNSLNATIKWNFSEKFFFESSFKYNSYKNERFGFNQNIPIWNASVRRLLTKNNRVELRLAAFDILDKNRSISQLGSQNFVSRTISETLARYFMLSATYNVRGFENKLKKNDWW